MLGNVFSPIAGVLIADYILVKRMQIDLVALFEPNGPYWYWRGVNPIAVVWTALGFLAYMFVIPADGSRCWSPCWRPVPAIGRRRAAGLAFGRARPGGAAGPRTRGGRRPRLGIGPALSAEATGTRDRLTLASAG